MPGPVNPKSIPVSVPALPTANRPEDANSAQPGRDARVPTPGRAVPLSIGDGIDAPRAAASGAGPDGAARRWGDLLRTSKHWASQVGDLAPRLLADVLRRPIRVVSDSAGGRNEVTYNPTNPQPDVAPLQLYLAHGHYDVLEPVPPGPDNVFVALGRQVGSSSVTSAEVSAIRGTLASWLEGEEATRAERNPVKLEGDDDLSGLLSKRGRLARELRSGGEPSPELTRLLPRLIATVYQRPVELRGPSGRSRLIKADLLGRNVYSEVGPRVRFVTQRDGSPPCDAVRPAHGDGDCLLHAALLQMHPKEGGGRGSTIDTARGEWIRYYRKMMGDHLENSPDLLALLDPDADRPQAPARGPGGVGAVGRLIGAPPGLAHPQGGWPAHPVIGHQAQPEGQAHGGLPHQRQALPPPGNHPLTPVGGEPMAWIPPPWDPTAQPGGLPQGYGAPLPVGAPHGGGQPGNGAPLPVGAPLGGGQPAPPWHVAPPLMPPVGAGPLAAHQMKAQRQPAGPAPNPFLAAARLVAPKLAAPQAAPPALVQPHATPEGGAQPPGPSRPAPAGGAARPAQPQPAQPAPVPMQPPVRAPSAPPMFAGPPPGQPGPLPMQPPPGAPPMFAGPPPGQPGPLPMQPPPGPAWASPMFPPPPPGYPVHAQAQGAPNYAQSPLFMQAQQAPWSPLAGPMPLPALNLPGVNNEGAVDYAAQQRQAQGQGLPPNLNLGGMPWMAGGLGQPILNLLGTQPFGPQFSPAGYRPPALPYLARPPFFGAALLPATAMSMAFGYGGGLWNPANLMTMMMLPRYLM